MEEGTKGIRVLECGLMGVEEPNFCGLCGVFCAPLKKLI